MQRLRPFFLALYILNKLRKRLPSGMGERNEQASARSFFNVFPLHLDLCVHQ